MKIKYDKQFGHWITLDNFVIFFSNKYCDLNYLRSKKAIQVHGVTIDSARMAICDQVHSDRLRVLDRRDCGAGFLKSEIEGYDAMITDDTFIIPVVKTADCIPVLLFDNESGVVAAIHSGRDGTRKNIVKNTIEMMKNTYNCKPDNMFAFVGPGIGKKNYEVSEEIFREFVKETKINQDFFKLDIRKVINNQLQNEGIRKENLFILNIDTYSNESYYSYRRDQSTGRQISLIFKIDKK